MDPLQPQHASTSICTAAYIETGGEKNGVLDTLHALTVPSTLGSWMNEETVVNCSTKHAHTITYDMLIHPMRRA